MIKKENLTKNWTLLVGIGIIFIGLIIYFTVDILNFKFPNKNTKSNFVPAVEIYTPTPIIAEQTPIMKLVKDVVCKKMVDPVKSAYYAAMLDQYFYFCSKECYDKFEEDPIKYLPLKYKVKIKLKETPSSEGTYEPIPPSNVHDAPLPEITIRPLPQQSDYPPGTIETSPESGGEGE